MFKDTWTTVAVAAIAVPVVVGIFWAVRDWRKRYRLIYCRECGAQVHGPDAAGLCARCAPAARADWSKVDLGKFEGAADARKDERLQPDVRGVQEKGTEPRGEP
jgi:hypothetical protein